MLERSFPLALVTLFVVAAACSAGGGGPLQNDASVQDVVTLDFAFGDLPEGCPPGVANDKGIGAPCSEGGNECGGTLFCTCDGALGVQPPQGTPCFCTSISFRTCEAITADDPTFCGQGASCCSYMNAGSMCVPSICLEGGMCPDFTTPPPMMSQAR